MKVPGPLNASIKSLGIQSKHLVAVEQVPHGPWWRTTVPGSDAIRFWQFLKDRFKQTGYWPVIVSGAPGPGTEFADELIEGWSMSEEKPEVREPKAILAAAESMPIEKWIEQERDPEIQIAKHLREAEIWDGREFGKAVAQLHRDAAEKWRNQPKRELNPDARQVPPATNRNPPQQELSCLHWYDSKTHGSRLADVVVVLFVPVEFSWQIPACLSYSTREGKLPPEVHVSALKWLWDRHGAELVGIDSRILEVIPQTRPRGKTEAVLAADMLIAYSACPSTSENEYASLEELAHYLIESKFWSFCWP